jgi:hypothetical protein
VCVCVCVCVRVRVCVCVCIRIQGEPGYENPAISVGDILKSVDGYNVDVSDFLLTGQHIQLLK